MEVPSTFNAIDFAGASVLLVDDKPVDVANFNEAFHISIQRSSTLEDGLSAAAEGEFDLMLGNLNLGGGADILRMFSQLRAFEKTRQTPVLMMGDTTQIDRLAKALDLGVNKYVVGLFGRNELIAWVRTQIRRRRFQGLLRQSYEAPLPLVLTNSSLGLCDRRYLLTYLKELIDGGES